MPEFLGIDTSNYTTSVAVFDSDSGEIRQFKQLLPVKAGEIGLRQSDAVFHHTKQLPELMEKVCGDGLNSLAAVSASSRPRNINGSYMPCFLCGEGMGRALASACGLNFYRTSHQVGHILAALYSAKKLELAKERFIAFHVSGGTTDCLLCEPDDEYIIGVNELGSSLDLKAGQAIDRTGVMLGLPFPCGPALEKLANKSQKRFPVKTVIRDGSCCLSGLENQCKKMLDNGEHPENIARYCLDFIAETVLAMTASAIEKAGELPIVFAGGVMSDFIIRERIISDYPDASFAAPEFSCDNAAGVALYGWLRSNGGMICL